MDFQTQHPPAVPAQAAQTCLELADVTRRLGSTQVLAGRS